MTDEAMSPLRRRMIEDRSIRKFAPKTQHDYVQRVKDFAAFLGRTPDTAMLEDVRGFQLRLMSSGAGTPKINAAVSALRFFFNVTLDRPDLARHLSFVRDAQGADCFKLRGGRALSGGGTWHQVQGGPIPSSAEGAAKAAK